MHFLLKGFFQAYNGFGECSQCPAGSFRKTDGLSSVTGQCIAGAYSAYAATVCTSCAAGSFQSIKEIQVAKNVQWEYFKKK